MATVTKVIPKGPDTRTISGPALDAVIEEILRPVPIVMRKLMTRHLARATKAVRNIVPRLEPFQKRDPYLALVAGSVKCIDLAENRVLLAPLNDAITHAKAIARSRATRRTNTPDEPAAEPAAETTTG